MAIRWKIVLPMIGMALALTAGRMVADWSTPDEPVAPLAAGFTAFADQRYSRAELLFEEARTLDPDNGDVYHGLALVALARHGDRERAEALFRQAIGSPAVSPVAFANFGRFLINENRYDAAIPVLKAGVARDPAFEPARARLAIALFAAGRIAEACRVARSVHDVPDAEEPLIDRIRDTPDCVTR